jgi:hypothetical protein
MKKIIAICILISVSVLGFPASEELEFYSVLYNGSMSNSAQLGILQSIVELKLTGAGDFYAKALRRLVSEYNNINNVTEKNAADEQAMILAQLLGSEKYTAAASDLWLVARDFQDPLVRAEALMSLGKVQATAFLPQVISVLNSLNMAPTADRLNGERVAFGAVIALEKFKDPSCYLPVYFASVGWYSDRIKNQAVKSLAIIADDPSPFMTDIVKSPGYNYQVKYAALKSLEASNVSNDKKAALAVAALTEGWRANTSDVNLRNILGSMRKDSMDMIRRYGTQDETVYPLLERGYNYQYDLDERKLAIRTISALATDESARRLSNYIMDLNRKRQAGNITQIDETLIRELIPALGATKRPIARPALNAVTQLDWVPAVKNLATAALRQLP